MIFISLLSNNRYVITNIGNFIGFYYKIKHIFSYLYAIIFFSKSFVL